MTVHLYRSLAVALLIAASAHAAEPAKSVEPSVELVVEVIGPILADFPIQVKVTSTDPSRLPSINSPAPPGMHLAPNSCFAEATDASGHTFSCQLRNAEFPLLTIGRIEKSETILAACDPLGPGTYTFRIVARPGVFTSKDVGMELISAASSRPITLKVKEDRDARLAAEQDLLARAKKDRFAGYIARAYGIDPIAEDWLDDLLSDDQGIVLTAVLNLTGVRRLPPAGDDMLGLVVTKHCQGAPGEYREAVLGCLAIAIAEFRTEESLDAELAIAESQSPDPAQGTAIWALAFFPQKRAEDALVRYMKSKNAALRWEATRSLAERRNRLAIAPLVEAATIKGLEDDVCEKRCEALLSLGCFRGDPAVAKVLRDAMDDPDSRISLRAKAALRGADFHCSYPQFPGRPYPK